MKIQRTEQSGAAMPEAAISVLFFLSLIFAGMQLIIIAYHAAVLQYLVSQSARIAALNSCTPMGVTTCPASANYPGATQADKRAFYVWNWIVNEGPKWGLTFKTTGTNPPLPNTQELEVRIVPLQNVAASRPNNPVFIGGTPGLSVMTIEVKRRERLFFDKWLCGGSCNVMLRGISVARLERL